MAMQDSDFAYIVSHDLRAHLRHINAFAGLLREELGTSLSPDAASYLNQLTEAARLMGLQLDGLRELAQLERASAKLQVLDMAELVAQARDLAVQKDPSRQIDWQVAQDFPAVLGDASMVQQVWKHLFSNATKFTGPRAQAVIAVGWERSSHSGVTFFVQDNGVGFEPRGADQLFNVFRRQHSASEFPGIGMGLALTRTLVQRMGGQVQIAAQTTAQATTQTPAGCRVSFTLPADESSTPRGV